MKYENEADQSKPMGKKTPRQVKRIRDPLIQTFGGPIKVLK